MSACTAEMFAQAAFWRPTRVSQAQIVNVSASGAQLRLDEKIPVRSYVTCNDERLGIRGRPSVRYCNFAKGKYEIGLEFSNDNGWGVE